MGDVVGSCDRAREWISADLDGELSEIERALLRVHVAGCASCAEHVRAVAGATVQLRFAALEQPELAPFAVPRGSRVSLRTVQAVAAAAAVAGAAGLGTLFAAPQEPSSPVPRHVPSRIVDVTDQKLLGLGRTYLKTPQQSSFREAQ
jgi:anti-sigma factor RsiW